MAIADVPAPWWAVGMPSGVRPGQDAARQTAPVELESPQEREEVYHRMKLARAETSLPLRPVAARSPLTPEQRRAYLRKIGVVR